MDRRSFLKASALLLADAWIPRSAYAAAKVVYIVPLAIESRTQVWQPGSPEGFPEHLESFYRVQIRSAEKSKVTLGDQCFADDVLEWLRKTHEPQVLGLASAPLCIDKPEGHKRIGVSGYAEAPGTRAVVTTYWRCRNVSAVVAHRRTLDVMLHELGHNFGARDCEDSACTMYDDPTGKRRRLDTQVGVFCGAHKSQLQWILR